MSEGIEVQLNVIMAEFENGINLDWQKNSKSVAADAVKRLKSTSPKSKGGGDYAKGWRKKINTFNGYTIYNAKKPGLTHLLENGHVTSKGTRTRKFVHIKPVEEEFSKKLYEKCKEDISRGI